MIYLLAATSSQCTLPRTAGDDAQGWLRRFWRRIIKWLVEPIPFPSMTYDIECLESRYNQEESDTSASHDTKDERRPPKPR
jgi:hypothetical protein